MVLFYTGADKANASQKDSKKSLGGFVSSSMIPNGLLNNVFGKLSYIEMANPESQHRIIVLKNLAADIPAGSLRIYTDHPFGHKAKITIGITEPMIDTISGEPFFETLPEPTALPYYTEFTEYTLDVPYIHPQVLQNGQSIGLFLKRTITPENNRDYAGAVLTDAQWIEKFDTNAVGEGIYVDDIQLFVSW